MTTNLNAIGNERTSDKIANSDAHRVSAHVSGAWGPSIALSCMPRSTARWRRFDRCTRNATQNDQSNGHRPQYRQAHRLRCLFCDSHPLRFADRCLSERLSRIARDSTEAPVTKLGIFSFINCGCESAQDIILIIFDININYPALFASHRAPRPAENRLCTNTNTGASTRGRGNNTPLQRGCAAEASRPG